MKKRIFALAFALLLCFAFSVSVSAAEKAAYFVDSADLVAAAEEADINAKLAEISAEHGVDVVIVTVDSIGNEDAFYYATEYYTDNGYGVGNEKSGVLLLISMEYRDWAIVTKGVGRDAISDSDADSIFDSMSSDLADDDFAPAFYTFAEECDSYIYDELHFDFVINLIIALVIGLVVALIATGIMKGKLKSVRYQSAAANYVRQNSMKVTESKEVFLYNTVSRVARPKNTSSGGGRSGGSSGFGGSSGKF